MKKSLIFLVKFVAIFAFFHALLFVLDISFLQNSIASLEAKAFGLASESNRIFFDDAVFLIVPSCTGLVSTIVLGAVIFSLKKPELKKKIIIFLTGSIALMLLNLIRVYFVLWAGVNFNPKITELTHIISWFFVAFLILFLWYYLTKKICKIKSFDNFL